jgi:outer membrane protease
MNPYVGVAAGYLYNDIEASGEFLKFSDNVAPLDRALHEGDRHGLRRAPARTTS